MKRFVVALFVCMGLLVANANALTLQGANAKAAGYQHSKCGGDFLVCLNQDLRPTYCKGPWTGTNYQWRCDGFIYQLGVGGTQVCLIESKWSDQGILKVGLKECEAFVFPV